MRSIVALAMVAAFALVAKFAGTASAQELIGEGEKAGTKIVVRGLKRDEGNTVTLRFQVVNDGNTSQPMYQLIGNSLDGHAHLLDAANKKKYLVVKDSAGKCECAPIRGNVDKGSPVNLWVKFPAPPESVQKVTVVVDGFEPVESVPLTPR